MNAETLNIILSLPVYALWFGPLALGAFMALRYLSGHRTPTEALTDGRLVTHH